LHRIVLKNIILWGVILVKRFIIILSIFSLLFSVPVFAEEAEELSPFDSDVVIPEIKTLDPLNIDEDILTPEDDTITGTETKIINPNPLLNNNTFNSLDEETQKVYAAYRDVIPKVDTDDILQWILEKGYQIIHLLQVVAQPFSIIVFIISAFLALAGSVGRGDLAGRGMWGMIMSTIVYAVVLFAPVIMQTFVGWISS